MIILYKNKEQNKIKAINKKKEKFKYKKANNAKEIKCCFNTGIIICKYTSTYRDIINSYKHCNSCKLSQDITSKVNKQYSKYIDKLILEKEKLENKRKNQENMEK